MYGSDGIFELSILTKQGQIKPGQVLGVHAGRKDKDWETQSHLGGIRVTPEGFDEIEKAIDDFGSLTKIIVSKQ